MTFIVHLAYYQLQYKMIQVNMKIVFLLVCFLALATPFPHQLIKFTVSSYIVPDKSLTMELDIVTPRSPQSYPAMLYVTGLEGLLPSYFQSSLIDSIAEQGNVFITVSKLQSPNPEKVTHALSKVVDWISANFQEILSKRAPGVIADIKNRYMLMGHSAAAHATTEYLNSTCGDFKLQILLDGVDGVDPFGIKKDFIVTPGKFLPYAIPVLVFSTELDPESKGASPPCAPNNLSNQRFYNAMSGPKWYLNVSKYGHADFLNIEYKDIAGLVCATCKKDCNYSQYRQLVKEAILNFANAILNKNQTSLSIIEEAKFTIPTAFKHNYMNYDVKTKGGFCERVKTSNKHLEEE